MSETNAPKRTRLRELAAEEIRVILARRRMSAAELSRRTGIRQQALSRRMTGETAFDLDDLERIAEVLGVSVADLLPTGRTRGSSAEVTTRYPGDAERPTRAVTARTTPTRAPRPNGRPRGATSPGGGTPKQSSRRPAILPRQVRA